jgi:hypothetical protein
MSKGASAGPRGRPYCIFERVCLPLPHAVFIEFNDPTLKGNQPGLTAVAILMRFVDKGKLKEYFAGLKPSKSYKVLLIRFL